MLAGPSTEPYAISFMFPVFALCERKNGKHKDGKYLAAAGEEPRLKSHRDSRSAGNLAAHYSDDKNDSTRIYARATNPGQLELGSAGGNLLDTPGSSQVLPSPVASQSRSAPGSPALLTSASGAP